MKPLPSLVMLLLSFLMLAGFSGCGEDDAVTPEPEYADLYFPLDVGATWTYASLRGDTLFQREVTDSFELDGRLAYSIRSTYYTNNLPNYHSSATFAIDEDMVFTRVIGAQGAVEWEPLYMLNPDSVGTELIVDLNVDQYPSIRDVHAIDRLVNLPSGDYEGCLQIRNTSPNDELRSGYRDEYFAPGIGLIASYETRSFGNEPILHHYLLSFEP